MKKYKYIIATVVTLAIIGSGSYYFWHKHKTNVAQETAIIQTLQAHENALSYIICKNQIEGFDLTKCPK